MRTARTLILMLLLTLGMLSDRPILNADRAAVDDYQTAGRSDQATGKVDPTLLSGLNWRSIGPAMFGGRVVDVVGVPGKPDLLFVGAASSGLYKSTNGGTTFNSIFD